MEINILAVLACAVVSMAVGSVWYGPLFGQKWMEVCKVDKTDLAARKKMQQEAMPLYLVQFVLTFFQAYVLAHFIEAWSDVSGIQAALWIWAAFVIPTTAAASMWTAEPTRMKWARFLIQSGYYLTLFILFGLILSAW